MRRHDVARLSAAARPRDALTLINLLRHAYGDDRRLLFDRLAELVPPPPSVTFDSIRWDEWWMPVLKASGVEGLKKKKK